MNSAQITLNSTLYEVENDFCFQFKTSGEVVIQLRVTTCCKVKRLNAIQLSHTRRHRANTHVAYRYRKKWVHVLVVLRVTLT
jgi:hypothetical protein